eukprot:TRINITY_DN3691_c0_g1_i3.p1 TRINITY_DN3691_c0_g1~~TRINITY_DN3691_c0_g1_i3.p1  ORF type:complete len:854 (-),score=220.38 TRINITY_DN3691_c0_g1_i3:421-2982(-)
MDLSQVLLNAQSPNTDLRRDAEAFLQQCEAQNRPLYMYSLAVELSNERKPSQARRLSGIVLKNLLYSREEARNAQLAEQWVAMDVNVRTQIKQLILACLASPLFEARHTSAQVCAKIALVELPRALWPELIQQLVNNMTSLPAPADELKQATLETLGFICEEIDPDVIQSQSNQVLTAVVQGMRAEEPNDDVKLAAANALYNALEFVKSNFDHEAERTYIMAVVCEATLSQNINIRVAGFECLVKIASLYYEKLPQYMQKIFSITLECIKKDKENVVLQAIEFWSTLCDEEVYLLEEIQEAMEQGQTPPVCHQFIKGALVFLVPLVLETLTKQEEGADEDTWNVAMAGATCLGLIANVVKDDIVNVVIPFVQENITKPAWRQREAALMAFGSILEGPQQSISPLIVQAFPVLVQHSKDQEEQVQDTAVWVLGRICQLHPTAIKGGTHFEPLLLTLLECLRAPPKVASNAAWAIHNIAEAFSDEFTRPAETLAPYIMVCCQAFLQATERDDASDDHLRVSCYEAVNALVTNSGDDCVAIVEQLPPLLMERLEKTFALQILTAEDRDIQVELQALLCGVLQSCTQRLGKKVSVYSDRMMQLLLQVLNIKSASVHEEALMAVGQLINAIEADFEKYMPYFQPYLHLGLRNYEDYEVCTIAVGVVGDLCRALEKKLAPYCSDIVSLLLQNLQNPQLHRSVKPPILSCFGDIAMAIGAAFLPYMPVIMPMLQQASATTVNMDNDEMVDYLNELREGIFEAYTGILQGLRSDEKADQAFSYANHLVNFVAHVYADQSRTESLTRVALGVLGDIGHSFGPSVKSLLQQQFVRDLVRECLSSDNDSTRDVAKWVEDTINKL